MPPVLFYALFVVLGILPSLIWLFFYLQQDCHPEPKHLLIKTFLMGIILSPLAVILQLLFTSAFEVPARGVGFFLWAAFIEEVIKFLAVKFIVLRDTEFDEPVDAMIYMITAALGFAAMENILVMFRVVPDGLHATVGVWTLRFAGATLLHTLSSAILGYFLAMSWFFYHHKTKLIALGITMATIFHFTFNIFLSSVSNKISSLGYSTLLLVVMAFLVSVLFDKIKERRTTQKPHLA